MPMDDHQYQSAIKANVSIILTGLGDIFEGTRNEYYKHVWKKIYNDDIDITDRSKLRTLIINEVEKFRISRDGNEFTADDLKPLVALINRISA